MRENFLIYLDDCLLIPLNETLGGLLLVKTVGRMTRVEVLSRIVEKSVNTLPGLLAVFS